MTEHDPGQRALDEDVLWRSLGRLVHLLPRLLDDDMTRATGLSMTEFAILVCLSEAPQRRMRMVELAAAAALSPSRVTRVVNELARHALVERERHATDARGSVAVITDDGVRRVDGARARQIASARARIFDHIETVDLPVVSRVVQRLAAAAAADVYPSGPPE
jgi:DNA-binding MarR family transcriptional regulator